MQMTFVIRLCPVKSCTFCYHLLPDGWNQDQLNGCTELNSLVIRGVHDAAVQHSVQTTSWSFCLKHKMQQQQVLFRWDLKIHSAHGETFSKYKSLDLRELMGGSVCGLWCTSCLGWGEIVQHLIKHRLRCKTASSRQSVPELRDHA